ncbi:MAG TPA: VCBS repeat-containing protein [Polyangiaceae bacterium]|jgi:hypothetical protein|nr:VCBS repeat-containing protein [Polyangiaceae bacterium]
MTSNWGRELRCKTSILFLLATSALVACGGAGGSAANAEGGAGAASVGAAGAGPAAGTAGNGDALNTGEYDVSSFNHTDTDPPNYNPFNNADTTLLRRDETAFLATTSSGALTGTTLDDASAGNAFANLPATAASALSGMTLFDLTSGNVDDDGNVEIVAVGTTTAGLAVRIVDSDAKGMFDGQSGFAISDQIYKHAWVRTADFDGDGRAEILVVAVSDSSVMARVYDDAVHGFALLQEIYSGPGEEIAAAVGNFDDDPAPEVALFVDEGTDVKLTVFDDLSSNFKAIKSLTNAALGLPTTLVARGLHLEAGNFDGDARSEIAVFADGYDSSGEGNFNGIQVGYLDDADAGFALTQQVQRTFPIPNPESSYRYTNNWGWQTTVADTNGDGSDELFVLERESGDTLDWAVTHLVFAPELSNWAASVQHLTLASGVSSGSAAFMTVSAGRDDDCAPSALGQNCGADVIVAVRDGTTLTPHRIVAGVNGAVYVASPSVLQTVPIADAAGPVWAVGGDYDADSLHVRFTGQKWLELTRPQPLVILAAPPNKDGISQQSTSSNTTYEASTSDENETTNEYSITRKVTLSFDVPIPGAEFLSVGAHASMAQAFNTINTTSQSVSVGSGYAAAYPDSVVIFNGVLCMRYQYTITSSANPALVGTNMTVDVPVDSRIYKWTVDYYNQLVGTQGSQIGSDILPEVAGDPTSFPTLKQSESLIGGKLDDSGFPAAWASNPVSVGQGSSLNYAYVDLNTKVTDESSVTTSTEFGASMGAFVTAEYSQGWDSTAGYAVSVSKDTKFTGTVGDIQAEADYQQWFYSFGVFLYPTKLAHGESVQVVQYWTEGFGPGYTPGSGNP